MNNKFHPGRERIRLQFYERVYEFIRVSCQTQHFLSDEKVRCPCAKRRCRRYLDIESTRYHLYKNGFNLDYWVWTKYREVLVPENQFSMGYMGSSSNGLYIGNQDNGNVTWEDNLCHY